MANLKSSSIASEGPAGGGDGLPCCPPAGDLGGGRGEKDGLLAERPADDEEKEEAAGRSAGEP